MVRDGYLYLRMSIASEFRSYRLPKILKSPKTPLSSGNKYTVCIPVCVV